MIRQAMVTFLVASVVPALAVANSDTSKVMGGIDIADGQHTGDVSTVNGGIHIGENATVGHANTVNGGVHLGAHSTAAELVTVNGGIHLDAGARVSGAVHTVNGGVHIDNGGDVTGDLSNVNGGIQIRAAHVGGNIETVNGEVDIGPNAHIDGGLHVQKNSNSLFHFGTQSLPRVVIEPGTVIRGPLRFDRKVDLYVSDRATIGPVEGATPIKFSGDHPPE